MKTVPADKLMLVARNWSKRGENTDFRHFFKFFTGSVNISNNDFFQFDNALFRMLKRSARHDGYSSLSAALEWEVFKKSWIYRPKIIHFWFADHDYHFSFRTAKLFGAKIVGNFFFSIEEFERRMPDKSHLKHLDLITASGRKQMDYLSKYVHVIPHNNIDEVYNDMYGIGWCDTQREFEAKLKSIIEHTKGNFIFLHAGYNNWDNEMDNVVTDEIIDLAKEKDIKLISGHEHIHNIVKDTLFHTGSIMPMNIGELGEKFYWTSTKGLKSIDHKVGTSLENDDVILSREDLSNIKNYPQKCIQIKSSKSIGLEDLKLVKKELTIDILEDFTEQAVKNGFDKEFVEKLINDQKN